MISLSVGRIAEAVEGSLVGVGADVLVTNVVIDSHDATSGCMFVAIAGEHVDGHAFAREAVRAGSTAVLVARPLLDSAGVSLPCIVVDDPVIALGRLAAWYRRELLDCLVVAVTGSSGKTSTKDLIASLLSTLGPTVRAEGSFNTEVGLPLTILGANASTDYLVLEMGMRGAGHIAYLAELAAPDIGVVVNVGAAHVEMLGSRTAIAEAKGELIDALSGADVAILNADDDLVSSMAGRTSARIVMFGQAAHAAVRAINVRLDDDAHASFTLVDQRSDDVVTAPVVLRFSGEHFVSNAAAAAAVALTAGASVHEVAAALSAATPQSRWRMEVVRTTTGITVINDAYNANPDSVRAALATLAAMGRGRRTWAVLGEMRELGDTSVVEHEIVGRLVVSLDISRLVCVGEGTRPVQSAATVASRGDDRSVYVADVEAALELLERELRPGDVLLVKASRSVGLERVAIGVLDGVRT